MQAARRFDEEPGTATRHHAPRIVSPHLLEDEAAIAALLDAHPPHRRPRHQDGGRRPASPPSTSPRYLDAAGFEIVPVPVYYPDVTTILGKPVYRRLVDIPGDVDLVDVFRRAKELPGRVDDILAKRPRAVWFQLGIRDDAVAGRLAAAGIDVVQDRCLMVDHRHWLAARRS